MTPGQPAEPAPASQPAALPTRRQTALANLARANAANLARRLARAQAGQPAPTSASTPPRPDGGSPTMGATPHPDHAQAEKTSSHPLVLEDRKKLENEVENEGEGSGGENSEKVRESVAKRGGGPGRVMKTPSVPGIPRSGGERQRMTKIERQQREDEEREVARLREQIEREKAEAANQANPVGPTYVRAKLYPKQEACFFGAERWSLTEATTKGGKTSGAIVWLAEQAILGKEGQNFWWVAPVFPQAEVAYRRMAKAFPYDLRATHDSKMRISLANGTAIWFKSGETPDNLYGEDVFAAIVDEASRLREESWHALRSTLTATKGPCRMIGNVKGRRNWFYAMCRKAEMGERDMAYHKLTWRDAVEAGVIDAAEVEDARRLLPAMVFQELYEADAADDSGNPFGADAIAECVARVGGLLSVEPVTCWGWDLGKRQDWTCGVGLDRMQNVAAVERFQMPWREAKERIIKVTARLPALVDSTGVGDPILEDLQASHGSNFEGYYYTGKSKQDLMAHVRAEIQGRRVGIPDGVIRTELEQFEYEYTRTGVIYAAPSGAFDDAVNALALASKHWAGNGAGAFRFSRSERLERASYERGGRDRSVLV